MELFSTCARRHRVVATSRAVRRPIPLGWQFLRSLFMLSALQVPWVAMLFVPIVNRPLVTLAAFIVRREKR